MVKECVAESQLVVLHLPCINAHIILTILSNYIPGKWKSCVSLFRDFYFLRKAWRSLLYTCRWNSICSKEIFWYYTGDYIEFNYLLNCQCSSTTAREVAVRLLIEDMANVCIIQLDGLVIATLLLIHIKVLEMERYGISLVMTAFFSDTYTREILYSNTVVYFGTVVCG